VKSIRKGLKATRGGFIKRLKALFKGKSDLDAELEERIEEVFITCDVGARTAHEFIERIRKSLSSEELADPARVWQFVRDEARSILALPGDPPGKPDDGPLSILVLGVNGVGKTTTIGKLASLYKSRGQSVLLGAADTFRAAAVEQLEVWGKRIDVPVVKGKEGADPSSVVFDALKQARSGGHDVVIVDTAGRLHTKTPLMEELKKLRRVMGKAQPGAPHEVLLVLDATTGQNGVMQARTFLESLEVTGIVLTKLDGTAKGGVILGIGNELRIPVRYIGVGEGIEDLRPFDPDEFVEALFDEIEEEEVAA
jgi:fused signal recognition particle receptor